MWREIGLYGYPKNNQKTLACSFINNLDQINNNPSWILFGDFNLITSNNEKIGGNPLRC